MDIKRIDAAYQNALKGQLLDYDSIIGLLEIDPLSDAASKLGKAARDIAKKVTHNKGKIWASIGVDFAPCKMNCKFCAFGEKWSVARESHTWSDEDILSFAEHFISSGVQFITLRTTEHYDFDRLCHLSRQIRSNFPGDYQLVANTGEFNSTISTRLVDAGFNIVYHAIRLREGIDTPFDIKKREHTLKAVNESGMDLAFLVEPIGPEHTNHEIGMTLIKAMDFNAKLTGAMERIPVKGTPHYKMGQITPERLAQITAITRLAANYHAPDICVHSPSKLALEWGANVVVVDIGAIPRDHCNHEVPWNHFDIAKAQSWFIEAGYSVDKTKSFGI